DPPRFRRGNDEARRVESWLRVAAPLRNEVAHDVEEAALRSELRMRETLDIVDGAIVERDRDLGPGVVRSVLAGSEEPIGQRPDGRRLLPKRPLELNDVTRIHPIAALTDDLDQPRIDGRVEVIDIVIAIEVVGNRGVGLQVEDPNLGEPARRLEDVALEIQAE